MSLVQEQPSPQDTQPVEHRISTLVGRWEGADAADRSALRPQLVRDLAALVHAGPARTHPSATSEPPSRQAHRPAA
jgi:hypothetical protein